MKTIIMAFAILLAGTSTFAQAKKSSTHKSSQHICSKSTPVLCTLKW